MPVLAPYDFDEDFEKKIVALVLRDPTFNVRTQGLIEAGYINNLAGSAIVGLVNSYWQKYKSLPSRVVFNRLLDISVSKKRLREDLREEIDTALIELDAVDLSDRDFVVEEVASFAKHQAIINAIGKSVDIIGDRRFDEVEREMKQAFLVGANEGSEGHDAAADIALRARRRKDTAAGIIKAGITTGCPELDARLSAKGFGRGELSVLLGPAKRGKSFGLLNFAAGAYLAGYNVLFVTLENSIEVTTDRFDAFISQIKTAELEDNADDVAEIVADRLDGLTNYLKFEKFPIGRFSPADLQRLIEKYRSQGIVFDEIVVDYWCIMRASAPSGDSIEDSKSIGQELRAIAEDENAAMVTAIQSNRDGFKAHTAGAEHAAEDFNKVRLADVMFSINADDDEKAAGEARIYMAAVRNMEGGYTLNIKQDLSRATFIKAVTGRGAV